VDILIELGCPGKHIDGHKEITDFIMALLLGEGEVWVDNYDRELSRRKLVN
jgi:hypothetical protein